VFGFELLQLTGNVPGTFSMSDMIWSAIGVATGCIILFIVTRRKFINEHNTVPRSERHCYILDQHE
jgi:hypothetical protein